LPYGLGLGQEFAVLDCSLNYLTLPNGDRKNNPKQKLTKTTIYQAFHELSIIYSTLIIISNRHTLPTIANNSDKYFSRSFINALTIIINKLKISRLKITKQKHLIKGYAKFRRAIITL
jgi:hypothetical protein